MIYTNPFLSLNQQIVGDCYTSTEPKDNLLNPCDEFGSRFGGMEGERQAAEFFQTKMEAYGLRNVHLEPVEYTGWIRGEARLEIVSPVQRSIPCISLPHSPPAKLEGTIVDMGDGAPTDLQLRADEIRGKIVLTSSDVAPNDSNRRIHRSEKYGRSLLAGASGFVFVNHYPGYGPATGGVGHGGEEGLIPGFSICYEDGTYIQRLAKRTGEVKIRMTSTDLCRPMTSWKLYDTVDKVAQDDLREAAALAACLALRMASEEDWPVARRDEDVVRELLDTPEYREERELRARVRALYAQARQGIL